MVFKNKHSNKPDLNIKLIINDNEISQVKNDKIPRYSN